MTRYSRNRRRRQPRRSSRTVCESFSMQRCHRNRRRRRLWMQRSWPAPSSGACTRTRRRFVRRWESTSTISRRPPRLRSQSTPPVTSVLLLRTPLGLGEGRSRTNQAQGIQWWYYLARWMRYLEHKAETFPCLPRVLTTCCRSSTGMGDIGTGFRASPIPAVQGVERAFLRQPPPVTSSSPTATKIHTQLVRSAAVWWPQRPLQRVGEGSRVFGTWQERQRNSGFARRTRSAKMVSCAKRGLDRSAWCPGCKRKKKCTRVDGDVDAVNESAGAPQTASGSAETHQVVVAVHTLHQTTTTTNPTRYSPPTDSRRDREPYSRKLRQQCRAAGTAGCAPTTSLPQDERDVSTTSLLEDDARPSSEDAPLLMLEGRRSWKRQKRSAMYRRKKWHWTYLHELRGRRRGIATVNCSSRTRGCSSRTRSFGRRFLAGRERSEQRLARRRRRLLVWRHLGLWTRKKTSTRRTTRRQTKRWTTSKDSSGLTALVAR